MYNNKKDNIPTILNSMKSSQRAKPPRDLLANIQQKINQTDASIIPLRQLKWTAVAAILLLIINGLAIHQNYKPHQTAPVAEFAEGGYIISNYALYDE